MNDPHGLTEFKEWLVENGHAKGKVVGDIASRAGRVIKMFKISDDASYDLLILRMNKDSEFSGLSLSVKSQLRKAARLYRLFKGLDSEVIPEKS